jgi:hypothetical protein
MAHTPLKITIKEAHDEVKYGWEQAYNPEALAQAVDSLSNRPVGYRINIFFLARLCFRGILLPNDGQNGMAQGSLSKPSNDIQIGKRNPLRARANNESERSRCL